MSFTGYTWTYDTSITEHPSLTYSAYKNTAEGREVWRLSKFVTTFDFLPTSRFVLNAYLKRENTFLVLGFEPVISGLC